MAKKEEGEKFAWVSGKGIEDVYAQTPETPTQRFLRLYYETGNKAYLQKSVDAIDFDSDE